MLLITHILVALSSVAYSSFLFFLPTKLGVKISFSLIGLTLLTGTVLVFSKPADILSACITGLLYVVFVSITTISAQRRLSRLEEKVESV